MGVGNRPLADNPHTCRACAVAGWLWIWGLDTRLRCCLRQVLISLAVDWQSGGTLETLGPIYGDARMIETTCVNETRYHLESALRRRGLGVKHTELGTFVVETPHSTFSMSLMPGNKRIVISHGVKVDEDFRGQGIGKRLLALREEVAREAGINLLLATVRDDNAVEIHLLEAAGWKRLLQRKTGVSLWGKELA